MRFKRLAKNKVHLTTNAIKRTTSYYFKSVGSASAGRCIEVSNDILKKTFNL
jgi:hypothetical protein